MTTVLEDSTPIIRLYDNLIVPIRVMSDQGISKLREDVTAKIASDAATGLILDVSALPYMDSFVTRVVRDLALAARLMGVRTVLSGMSPEIAITIIEMGLALEGVKTTLGLERAIEELSRMRREAEETGELAAGLR
jgi:rsbT antagonist protein RsbS